MKQSQKKLQNSLKLQKYAHLWLKHNKDELETYFGILPQFAVLLCSLTASFPPLLLLPPSSPLPFAFSMQETSPE
jgi:hypothetical protein